MNREEKVFVKLLDCKLMCRNYEKTVFSSILEDSVLSVHFTESPNELTIGINEIVILWILSLILNFTILLPQNEKIMILRIGRLKCSACIWYYDHYIRNDISLKHPLKRLETFNLEH